MRLLILAVAAALAGCASPAGSPVTIESVTRIPDWCPGFWMIDPPVEHRVLVADDATAHALQPHVGERLLVQYERVRACGEDDAFQVTGWSVAP